MRRKIISIFLLLSFLAIPGFNGQSAPGLMEITIYDDALGQGWENWSWAQVNLAASAPVHSGSYSIAVTYGAWEGLYLHKAGTDTLGTTHLRFFVNGGGAGWQQVNVYMNLEVDGSPQNGPMVGMPPLPANTWLEVNIDLNTLNPDNDIVTGITWQDASGGSQPTLYIDDIAFISPEDPDGPQISDASLWPRSIPADGETSLVVRARVSDPQGAGDISAVNLDASSLDLGLVAMKDDGRSNDGAAGDGLYGTAFPLPAGTPTGEYKLLLSSVDLVGHASALPMGALNVLAPPGGVIPDAIPGHIGWGSNAWSETPGQDWQVESGLPWDYVYQYITYGWESWGTNFTYRFVRQAWSKGYIPMVTVYLMLGTPPDCGEGGACYASKLKNAATVQAYLDSLQRAAQEAQGNKAVIFNLEPDFYGFMQQLSNSNDPPPGVQPDDPSSYPVALNKSGYANTLAGFGRYMVDLVHATAPNALVAPMASMWATNGDPQTVTSQQAAQMAQRTAAFIDAMGGAQSDLLVVEWSDRDAGSGLRPWWDDTDRESPRPTRAILWANALSQASNKRLFLWQMPVGNMSLDNTCDHYQDNRAAYAFNHPRDLVDAGVVGVLFGGGAACMTQVWTDGGYVASQGAIAYEAPAQPQNLAVEAINGPLVNLRWDENVEPDLWRYRLQYQNNAVSGIYVVYLGKRNSYSLLLPQAGSWQITIAAQDAMGKQSVMSAPVNATTVSNAAGIHLPLVLR